MGCEQAARADSKEWKKKEIEADKEARRDPNWKAKASNSSTKGGKAVTGFKDIGCDLDAGG